MKKEDFDPKRKRKGGLKLTKWKTTFFYKEIIFLEKIKKKNLSLDFSLNMNVFPF